jgi:hypothetical protein
MLSGHAGGRTCATYCTQVGVSGKRLLQTRALAHSPAKTCKESVAVQIIFLVRKFAMPTHSTPIADGGHGRCSLRYEGPHQKKGPRSVKIGVGRHREISFSQMTARTVKQPDMSPVVELYPSLVGIPMRWDLATQGPPRIRREKDIFWYRPGRVSPTVHLRRQSPTECVSVPHISAVQFQPGCLRY